MLKIDDDEMAQKGSGQANKKGGGVQEEIQQ